MFAFVVGSLAGFVFCCVRTLKEKIQKNPLFCFLCGYGGFVGFSWLLCLAGLSDLSDIVRLTRFG
jgi:hypothetical protein